MMTFLSVYILGLFFGFFLHKGGLTHYARIVNVFRFTDLTVLKFMLSALVSGSILTLMLTDEGSFARLPIPQLFVFANILGGVIFGIGMASIGYCPGTIVAEMGEGRLDAALAGAPGLLFGALVFGSLEPVILKFLAGIGAYGQQTFATLTGAQPWLIVLVFSEFVFLLFVCITRGLGPPTK